MIAYAVANLLKGARLLLFSDKPGYYGVSSILQEKSHFSKLKIKSRTDMFIQ